MNKTENYQLNQWELADRIRMEDFNGDNAKIDAALKSQAEALAAETTAREAADATLRNENCWVKLKDVTVGAVNSVSISTADIDWSQYRMVEIVMSVQSSNYSAAALMQINGLSDNIYYTTSSTPGNYLSICPRFSTVGLSRVQLMAAQPGGAVAGLTTYFGHDNGTFNGTFGFSVPSIQLAAITSLRIYLSESTYLFTSGGKIAMYGLKA